LISRSNNGRRLVKKLGLLGLEEGRASALIDLLQSHFSCSLQVGVCRVDGTVDRVSGVVDILVSRVNDVDVGHHYRLDDETMR
ncbi:hypothetical protein PENTCL1PPCAC_11957, partial [Pristionchus entomophagus]